MNPCARKVTLLNCHRDEAKQVPAGPVLTPWVPRCEGHSRANRAWFHTLPPGGQHCTAVAGFPHLQNTISYGSVRNNYEEMDIHVGMQWM